MSSFRSTKVGGRYAARAVSANRSGIADFGSSTVDSRLQSPAPSLRPRPGDHPACYSGRGTITGTAPSPLPCFATSTTIPRGAIGVLSTSAGSAGCHWWLAHQCRAGKRHEARPELVRALRRARAPFASRQREVPSETTRKKFTERTQFPALALSKTRFPSNKRTQTNPPQRGTRVGCIEVRP